MDVFRTLDFDFLYFIPFKDRLIHAQPMQAYHLD